MHCPLSGDESEATIKWVREAEAALSQIVSWKNDTLGARPKEPGQYDCPPAITEAFDRGCRMAFYRCADRASQAL